ncbi:polysaccharide biosynthesis protein [Buchananella felis]|uniref:polysaccharide biosynthesis protein n=1 Tax=Buchananella felis TaxID=3231492 RepID=UPI003529A7CF
MTTTLPSLNNPADWDWLAHRIGGGLDTAPEISDAVRAQFAGKRVLVTGAGGSIGTELCRQIYQLKPSELVLLDRDESGLHATQLLLEGRALLDNAHVVLADLRDTERMEQIFAEKRPEIVVHAAALKHAPLLEQYPAEAWKTNVLGSDTVLSLSVKYGVKHLINISTDKAASPTTALGFSKRVAERLTSWYGQTQELEYCSVRFGNVLGARGSALWAFASQLNHGQPVTVTDPDVVRYFMTVAQACQLVLEAGVEAACGDVLVLDMGDPVRIVRVVEEMAAEAGVEPHFEFTGLRPGEKLEEIRLDPNEQLVACNHPHVSRAHVEPLDPAELAKAAADLPAHLDKEFWASLI